MAMRTYVVQGTWLRGMPDNSSQTLTHGTVIELDDEAAETKEIYALKAIKLQAETFTPEEIIAQAERLKAMEAQLAALQAGAAGAAAVPGGAESGQDASKSEA